MPKQPEKPGPDALDVLKVLRGFGVLQDVKSELVNISSGIIFMPCPDGNYFDELYMFLRKIFVDKNLYPRIHPLTEYGGALALPEESPIYVPNYLEKIDKANHHLGMTTIVFEAHVPCGAAKDAGISVLEQFRLYKLADEMIQKKLPGYQAVCLFHVWWGDKVRTYYVSGQKWREFQSLYNKQ
jgi:hypothetical protein